MAVTSDTGFCRTHARCCVPRAGSIMASSCSDRVGRRPLMITSHVGMAVSLLGTAAAACAPGKSAACCASCLWRTHTSHSQEAALPVPSNVLIIQPTSSSSWITIHQSLSALCRRPVRDRGCVSHVLFHRLLLLRSWSVAIRHHVGDGRRLSHQGQGGECLHGAELVRL